MYKWIKQGSKLLYKKGNRIIGYVGINANKPYFAYGKPSDICVITFECNTINEAKEKLILNLQ